MLTVNVTVTNNNIGQNASLLFHKHITKINPTAQTVSMQHSWRTAAFHSARRRKVGASSFSTSSTNQEETSTLLACALDRVRLEGTSTGTNLIAYSGGVDSSLVAALVRQVFPSNSVACIGLSASLPDNQLILARQVAAHIGIPLREVPTYEGSAPEYVANRGMSCFHCKNHLYTALQAVAAVAGTHMNGPLSSNFLHSSQKGSTETLQHVKLNGADASAPSVVALFNGTNADDSRDPTRVGLKAATKFKVRSPIDHLTKGEVRLLAKAMNLPNWRHAASPCLRSRLAFGVPALEAHLRRVETAERIVKATLGGKFDDKEGESGFNKLGVHHNVRVRLMARGKAMIELDVELLEIAASYLSTFEGRFKKELGFTEVSLRAFKSGSVSSITKVASGT